MDNKNREEKRQKKDKKGYRRGLRDGILICIAVIAAFNVASMIRTHTSPLSAAKQDRVNVLDSETAARINSLAASIRNQYYEEVPIEEQRDGLMRGLFDNLDVYSEYYTADELDKVIASVYDGSFVGIGVEVSMDQDTGEVMVENVIDDTPAQKAGIESGDILISADGFKAAEMDLATFISHIQGEKGTVVELLVMKAKTGETQTIKIKRAPITVATVRGEMIDDTTGYLRVSSFNKTTPEQFKKELSALKQKSIKYLIIDLRNNGGGVVTDATDCIDQILPKGLVVYMENRSGKRQEFYSTDKEHLDIPVAVLVNEYTASASEIFAGALQDRGAAKIVGTQTYGKGVVQHVYKLSDGSGYKLTTDKYYTPNGVCIHGKGITPDVEVAFEFLGKEDEEYSFAKDNQIQEALKLWR